MKLAFLMDPPKALKPYKDTTIGMMKKACEMGFDCEWFTPLDLFCKDGQAFANTHHLRIKDEHQPDWFESTNVGEQPLTAFDIILMRKDPPFDMEYIYATYALDLAEKAGVLIANSPQGLRLANEKFFTLQFPQCCPETLVTQDIARLKKFWEMHRDVIFKPLEGMGGKSVFYVDKMGKNLSVILELLTNNQTTTIMAQRYIPDILATGDKRILLINGEPVSHGLARIPAKGELRGNLAAGARGEVHPITERERWLAAQIAPALRANGLYFVGMDVIGGFLTEINVTSPTCMREISEAANVDIAGDYLRFISGKVRESSR